MSHRALLYLAGDKFSGGLVMQNYWSLGGNEQNKVNAGNIQYVAYYNFSQGWFIESNATVSVNWLASENSKWLIPVGGGPGKTFVIGKNSKLFYLGSSGFL